jgi:uncharacterized protein (DUF1015 family)
MANLQPFRAYRPKPELAEKIASPPYDVLTSREARSISTPTRYTPKEQRISSVFSLTVH